MVCGRGKAARGRPFRRIHASFGGCQTAAFVAVGLERSIDRVRRSTLGLVHGPAGPRAQGRYVPDPVRLVLVRGGFWWLISLKRASVSGLR